MNFECLKTLNINLKEPQKETIIKYIELFKQYNSHTNLISKNDVKYIFEKHIYDSLAFNLLAEKYNLPETIMDIGTGGGFPGIPLAILYPDTEIFAVDSTAKKINFLLEVKEKLSIENLKPTVSRIEELPLNLKESFAVVTTRALGALPLVLEYSIPYLKTGGYFVAFKSKEFKDELKSAENALKVLNTKLVDTIEYKLPLEENFDRKLLLFKKEKSISSIYPRKYNIIKKSPL